MLVFVPLTDIVIIISIIFQCLFLFCVFIHSCSTDAILVFLRHLIHHSSGILPHCCDYNVHFCGSENGSTIVPTPHSCGFCLGCVHLNIGHNFSSTAASSFSAGLILLLLPLSPSYYASTSSTALYVLSPRSVHELYEL